MTKGRLRQILTLLGSLAMAVLPVWADPQQTLPAQIAVTISTALFLLVRPDELRTMRSALLGGLAVAGVLIAGISGRFTTGSAGIAIVGTLAAVVTNLRAIIARAAPLDTDDAVTKPETPAAKVAVIVQPDTTPKK